MLFNFNEGQCEKVKFNLEKKLENMRKVYNEVKEWTVIFFIGVSECD
jgi:hypothetical protein